jgi:hypothetical protein
VIASQLDVQVDVGRAAPLLRQEALEQKLELDGIYRRDPQAIADAGVGRRTTTLQQDPPAPGKAHDIPDGEEVPRQVEPRDHLELAPDLASMGSGTEGVLASCRAAQGQHAARATPLQMSARNPFRALPLAPRVLPKTSLPRRRSRTRPRCDAARPARVLPAVVPCELEAVGRARSVTSGQRQEKPDPDPLALGVARGASSVIWSAAAAQPPFPQSSRATWSEMTHAPPPSPRARRRGSDHRSAADPRHPRNAPPHPSKPTALRNPAASYREAPGTPASTATDPRAGSDTRRRGRGCSLLRRGADASAATPPTAASGTTRR